MTYPLRGMRKHWWDEPCTAWPSRSSTSSRGAQVSAKHIPTQIFFHGKATGRFGIMDKGQWMVNCFTCKLLYIVYIHLLFPIGNLEKHYCGVVSGWQKRTIVLSQKLGWCVFLSIILPGKLTENTFSFTAMTWGIVTGERRGMNEPIVRWGWLGDCDGIYPGHRG